MSVPYQISSAPQVYTAHVGASLLSEVAYSICVLFPRALVTAGFHEKGHTLMVRCSENDASRPEWDASFFEHAFINDPLLVGPQPVKAVFMAPEAFLLTPEAFYVPEKAEEWLGHLFFREHDFTTGHHFLSTIAAHITYFLPQKLDGLVRRYFSEAALLPVVTSHFCNSLPAGHQLQCTIAPANALASIRSNGQLLWCQEFAYTNAEDIAYHLKTALQQYGLKEEGMRMDCCTAGISANATAEELCAYFPGMSRHHESIITHDSQWGSTLYFLLQVRTCVS